MVAGGITLGSPNIPALRVQQLPIGMLRPNPKNPRTHSRRQIRQLAANIRKLGFINPVIVDSNQMILAGHGRVEAARLAGLTDVSVIQLDHLTATQRRAYLIADNRLAMRMVPAARNAPSSLALTQHSNRVSANIGLRCRETRYCQPETKAPKRPLKSN